MPLKLLAHFDDIRHIVNVHIAEVVDHRYCAHGARRVVRELDESVALLDAVTL